MSNKYLLDTHTLLWWVSNDKRLSARVCDLLADDGNQIFLSSVSAWEIAIKAGTKRLTIPVAPLEFITRIVEEYKFLPLPVSLRHAALVHALPPIHNDPFDRLLIAQSREEDLPLLTDDGEIRKYEISLMW